jgi:hypothetical protein
MQNRNRGNYQIAGSEVVAEGADMRVDPGRRAGSPVALP